MKYVLVPTELAEKITLHEALFWIGFNMYFTAKYSEDHNEMREDTECRDTAIIDDSYEIDLFFTEEVCNKYGLPKSYLPEYFEESGGPPYDPYSGWANFSERKLELPQEYVEQLENDKKEYDDFLLKQNSFDEALEDYLEIPKSRLFIELKKGNVQAFGREVLASLVSNGEYEADELKRLYSLDAQEWFGSHEEGPELLPISAQTIRGWINDGILEAMLVGKTHYVYGAILKQFLKDKSEKRKHTLDFKDYKCWHCKAVFKPVDNIINRLSYGRNKSLIAHVDCECGKEVERPYKLALLPEILKTFTVKKDEVTVLCDSSCSTRKTHIENTPKKTLM